MTGLLQIVIGILSKIIYDFFKKTFLAVENQKKQLEFVTFEMKKIIDTVQNNSKLKIVKIDGGRSTVPDFRKILCEGTKNLIHLLVKLDTGENVHKLLSTVEVYNRHLELFYSIQNYAANNQDLLNVLANEIIETTLKIQNRLLEVQKAPPAIYKIMKYIKIVSILAFLYPENLRNENSN